MLAAVKVTAATPGARDQPGAARRDPEPGSAEKWNDGVNGQVSPDRRRRSQRDRRHDVERHDDRGGAVDPRLGRRIEPHDAERDGARRPAASRARRARRRASPARRSTPTRGGFAGANIDVRLGPGSRNYQRRNAFITFDPPQLQFTDAGERALGATSGGFRGSFGADGELIRRALTYNVALDVARTASDPATLLSADADALLRAGVAPDSVARLHRARRRRSASRSTGAGVPANRERNGDQLARPARRHARHAADARAHELRRLHARWRARLRAARRAVGRRRAARAHARRAAHARRLRRDGTTRPHRDAARGERA